MHNNQKGFSLIELMIAMAISAIVLAGIYTTYQAQHESYIVQEQAAAMQQNIRAAMYHLERDIRMVGYDPMNSSGATFLIANSAELQIQADLNGNGTVSASGTDPNEQMRYHLTNDGNDDGIADGAPCRLGKEIWAGGLQSVAENIDALNFVYLDRTGAVTAVRGEIRAVQVTIVARAARAERGYVNNNQYFNQNPNGAQVVFTAPGDSYRRKRLSIHIDCRNMGL